MRLLEFVIEWFDGDDVTLTLIGDAPIEDDRLGMEAVKHSLVSGDEKLLCFFIDLRPHAGDCDAAFLGLSIEAPVVARSVRPADGRIDFHAELLEVCAEEVFAVVVPDLNSDRPVCVHGEVGSHHRIEISKHRSVTLPVIPDAFEMEVIDETVNADALAVAATLGGGEGDEAAGLPLFGLKDGDVVWACAGEDVFVEVVAEAGVCVTLCRGSTLLSNSYLLEYPGALPPLRAALIRRSIITRRTNCAVRLLQYLFPKLRPSQILGSYLSEN